METTGSISCNIDKEFIYSLPSLLAYTPHQIWTCYSHNIEWRGCFNL